MKALLMADMEPMCEDEKPTPVSLIVNDLDAFIQADTDKWLFVSGLDCNQFYVQKKHLSNFSMERL